MDEWIKQFLLSEEFQRMFFSLITISIMGAFFFITHRKRVAKQKEFLSNQALKRNGTVISGVFDVRMEFSYQGLEAKVYSMPGSKNSPPHTYVIFALQTSRDYNITINRESSLSKLGKVFGLQDIKVNNPEFGNAFIVRSKEEILALEVLTQKIQSKLLQIKETDPTLQIKKKKFILSIPSIPEDDQGYDDVIDMALAFIGRLVQLG